MAYVSGFLVAVPDERKQDYIDHARQAWPLFKAAGALEMIEAWGVDVPDGEVTSFPMAVKKKDGESVVFSWMIWPDRATADACFHSMQDDPQWEAMGEMPFDGKRMMWGGFEPILEAKTGARAA